MRPGLELKVSDIDIFKRKLLAYTQNSTYACYLDSNNYPNGKYHNYDCLVALDALEVLEATAGNAFNLLQEKLDSTPDWWFGYLAYDLKNEVENLQSNHPDHLHFPDMVFFRPRHVFTIKGEQVMLYSDDRHPMQMVKQLQDVAIPEQTTIENKTFASRFSRDEYLETVNQLKQHIKDGDIYEINFCQEFYIDDITLNPIATFQRFNDISAAPFSAYFRRKNQYALCCSPERFLQKQGNKLISQPIKGTRRRSLNPTQDERYKAELKDSLKDRAENVMIVDLVRNDLARSCQPGTVKVEELFGIHTFRQVHHMMSTVVGQLRPDCHPVEAIKNAFPMGSMTGAPKVRMMQLAEQYERSKRSVYSGAIGYFTPDGNFDLNVVIRSLFYNADTKYLSFHTGGAIVWDSVPEEEYEECLVKGDAMLKAVYSNRPI